MVDRYRLGVDIGGTFTDFVLLNEASGAVEILKIPTTPRAPADAEDRCGVPGPVPPNTAPPDAPETAAARRQTARHRGGGNRGGIPKVRGDG